MADVAVFEIAALHPRGRPLQQNAHAGRGGRHAAKPSFQDVFQVAFVPGVERGFHEKALLLRGASFALRSVRHCFWRSDFPVPVIVAPSLFPLVQSV